MTTLAASLAPPATIAFIGLGKLGGSADHTEIFRYAEMLAEEDS